MVGVGGECDLCARDSLPSCSRLSLHPPHAQVPEGEATLSGCVERTETNGT